MYNIYIYIYIYIHTRISTSLSLSIYIYIYIYICMETRSRTPGRDHPTGSVGAPRLGRQAPAVALYIYIYT